MIALQTFGVLLVMLPVPAVLTWALTVRWRWIGGMAGIVLWDLLVGGAIGLSFFPKRPDPAASVADPLPSTSVFSSTPTFAEAAFEIATGVLSAWPLHLTVLSLGLLCIASGFETRRRRVAAARAGISGS